MPARGLENLIGVQRLRPQARHGVAEMIDIDDAEEVRGPSRADAGFGPNRLARHALARRDHRRHRREQIAPVKAGRELRGPPGDVRPGKLPGAYRDHVEQAVVGPDEEPAIGADDGGRAPPRADAGIDDAEVHRARFERLGIGREQVGGRLDVVGRRIGEQVNHRDTRRHAVKPGFHLTEIGTGEPEIGEKHDHEPDCRREAPRTKARARALAAGFPTRAQAPRLAALFWREGGSP